MITKGIRGAITLNGNTKTDIEQAVNELLKSMIDVNAIEKDRISHVIFTTTNDINAEFPAKFARLNFGWDEVAMMCYHELDVPDALDKCLRVLIVYNCELGFVPHFVYLKGAGNLRK